MTRRLDLVDSAAYFNVVALLIVAYVTWRWELAALAVLFGVLPTGRDIRAYFDTLEEGR